MTRTIDEPLAEVRKRWSEQHIQTEPPATLADLRTFESIFNVQCPKDFATYLTTLGGMNDGTWDEHLIRFWPLREIRPVEDMHRNTGYFVFADFLISSHEYAVQCGRTNRSDVVLVGGPTLRTIAATFAEFVALYLEEAGALF